MIAFISYSISEAEQYILTLLAQKLREKGFALTTGYNQFNYVDLQTVNEISNAHLFIGLVAYPGSNAERVYQQFNQALLHNKPSILLIEDIVKVPSGIKSFPNIVRFNRRSPHIAVEEVKNRIKVSQNYEAQQQNGNAAAWILGGIAALALLSLLTSEKKK